MRFLDHKVNTLAEEGLKMLLYAYKDMTMQEYEWEASRNGNFETEQSREVLEKGLILLSLFGLDDPIREEVMSEFEKLKCELKDIEEEEMVFPETTLRILSGDHKETVLSVAKQCGLDHDS